MLIFSFPDKYTIIQVEMEPIGTILSKNSLTLVCGRQHPASGQNVLPL